MNITIEQPIPKPKKVTSPKPAAPAATGKERLSQQVQKILDVASKETAAWIKNTHEEGMIGVRVHEILEGKMDRVVLSLLGMKKSSWNESWEVEHSSAFSQACRQNANATALKLLETVLGGEFTLTAAQATSIQNTYCEALLKELKDAARRRAEADAERILSETLGVNGLITDEV